MAEQKTIVVMGATGAQGGNLVRAIMNDPSGGFSARAVTRDANTDFYWDNLLFGLAPRRGEDGKLAITLPMGGKKLAGIAAKETFLWPMPAPRLLA